MLKTYEDGEFVYDAKNNVYYDISTLTSAPSKIEDDPEFTKITYRQNGQTVEKYISKSDLETHALTEANVYNSVCYSKDESGTAESLAYASGNGKINYYYTLRKTLNKDWQYYGTGWLDRKTAMAKGKLAVFKDDWSYSNGGKDDTDVGTTTDGKGVWRVKEILEDGTEGGWLDETVEYNNRFLLRVNLNKPQYVYDTAGELLNQLGGYTQISGSTDWKKTNATEYMAVSANGTTYYLPKNGITLYDGKDPAPSASQKISVKYYKNGKEENGYVDMSKNPTPYYKIYQDDIQGNDTTLNPMFVDELGNVQYCHERDTKGKEIATNEDGSVAYKTISPKIDPHTDTALMNRVVEEAVKKLIADLPEEETETLDTREKQLAYLKAKYSTQYNAEVTRLFNEVDFPYLVDEEVKFFDKDDFNLKTSVFDSFELVKMTEYSYLNMKGDNRSINNLFTNTDAIRTN